MASRPIRPDACSSVPSEGATRRFPSGPPGQRASAAQDREVLNASYIWGTGLPLRVGLSSRCCHVVSDPLPRCPRHHLRLNPEHLRFAPSLTARTPPPCSGALRHRRTRLDNDLTSAHRATLVPLADAAVRTAALCSIASRGKRKPNIYAQRHIWTICNCNSAHATPAPRSYRGYCPFQVTITRTATRPGGCGSQSRISNLRPATK